MCKKVLQKFYFKSIDSVQSIILLVNLHMQVVSFQFSFMYDTYP